MEINNKKDENLYIINSLIREKKQPTLIRS